MKVLKKFQKLSPSERKALEKEFSEVYNPLKIYPKLRKLGIRKEPAMELCRYYEEVLYKRALDLYYNEKEKNRLENSV